MRKVFTTMAAIMVAGAAFAEAPAVSGPMLSGEVELKFTQDATTDKWGGAMGLDLGIDANGVSSVDLDLSAQDGGSVTLDNWTVGTNVAGVGVAVGDDNGVFVGAEGEQTIAAPAMTESVKVTVGDAAVAVGLTDWTTDAFDISNIQGSYAIGDVAGLSVTASGDYNLDSENIVLGGAVGGLEAGPAGISSTVTYDVDAELWGFEGVATMGAITAYANGDDTDLLQNVGGDYEYNLGGATLNTGMVYNLDSEEFTPSASVSFNF